MVHRPTFTSCHRAKAYLVYKIVEQAIREGQPLSDAESRLLYFTEQEPTIANEVVDQFPDLDLEYEAKIEGLLRRRFKHERTLAGGGESQGFVDAAALLRTEDHYLSVMADKALGGPTWSLARYDLTKVNPTQAVLIVIGLVFGIGLAAWLMGRWLQ